MSILISETKHYVKPVAFQNGIQGGKYFPLREGIFAAFRKRIQSRKCFPLREMELKKNAVFRWGIYTECAFCS